MKDWKKNEKKKKRFLIALATVIEKDPTTSIRKHANEENWGQQLSKI